MSASTLRKPEENARPARGQAFAKGRRAWDEWIGAAIRRERFAYLGLFGALAVAGVAVWDAHEQHEKGQFIPYVIERSASGHRIAAGVLDGPRTLTDAQIGKRLLTWLQDTRMIVADYAGLRALVTEAYSMTLPGSLAQQKLIAFHQAQTPEDRAGHYTVYLSRETAERVQNRTWQLEWCEHTMGRDGSAISDDLWRMTATYEVDPPTAVADMDKNPEGFFVIDFDWRKPPQQVGACPSTPAGDQP